MNRSYRHLICFHLKFSINSKSQFGKGKLQHAKNKLKCVKETIIRTADSEHFFDLSGLISAVGRSSVHCLQFRIPTCAFAFVKQYNQMSHKFEKTQKYCDCVVSSIIVLGGRLRTAETLGHSGQWELIPGSILFTSIAQLFN